MPPYLLLLRKFAKTCNPGIGKLHMGEDNNIAYSFFLADGTCAPNSALLLQSSTASSTSLFEKARDHVLPWHCCSGPNVQGAWAFLMSYTTIEKLHYSGFSTGGFQLWYPKEKSIAGRNLSYAPWLPPKDRGLSDYSLPESLG